MEIGKRRSQEAGSCFVISCDPGDRRRRSDSLLLLIGFNGTLCGALLPSPGETLSRLSGLVHSDALPAPV